MRILFNANIHTLSPLQSSLNPDALAVQSGRVLALGRGEDIDGEFSGLERTGGQKIERLDLQGRTVLPGLTDAHIHLENYALGLQKVDCETDSRGECLARVAEKARTTPPGEWVLGHGWNQNNWPEDFGSAALLDAAAPGHPVYLTAKSLHAAWANSAALRLAGIGPDTPDPQGGRIGRDLQGRPDGILFESAMGLLDAVIPAPVEERVADAILQAQRELWRLGVTGGHDFDRRRCFIALQRLQAQGELRLRVLKSIPLDDLPHAVALGLQTGYGDDWLRIGGVKAFADGALGPQTAAMLQPYENSGDDLGMLLLDAEELFEQGRSAVENGLSLAVHAIGDRANHEVLDAYTQLRQHELAFTGAARLRHRIEHVQLIHPDDAGRLAKLGIIASMQPVHAASDMVMADRYWGKRAALSYAWRTQLGHGARLAFGSDAPVESPNPFWGLHTAVTRCRQDGYPGAEGWYPRERLALQEALQAYTTGAAYAAGMEDRLGQLAPGFLADLIVLDQDPYTCSPAELAALKPAATMIGGEWVFSTLD
jgi:predicted amidohydrolase YtcJ